MKALFPSLLAASLLAVATPTLAHTGHGLTADLEAGLLHPLTGPDHVFAMTAVGLWACLIGGTARWLMPLSFLICMAGGALLPGAGIDLPHAEAGARFSLVVMGLALLTSWWLKALPAAAVAGLFATFHGYLHGAEIVPGSDGWTYGLGFLVATAVLHGTGLLLGLTLTRLQQTGWFRALGAICAGFGLYLLATG